MVDSAKRKKPKLLVAEDEEFLSMALHDKFTREKYTVVIAKNGVEVLELIESENPDIILLDLMMPIKGGFEVLEELKAKPDFNTPVIILTNSDVELDKKKSQDLGAQDFWIKADHNITDVVDKVRILLKKNPSS